MTTKVGIRVKMIYLHATKTQDNVARAIQPNVNWYDVTGNFNVFSAPKKNSTLSFICGSSPRGQPALFF